MTNNNFRLDGNKKREYLDNVEQTRESATYDLYTKLIYRLDEFEKYKNNSATNMTKSDFLEFFTSLNSTSASTLSAYRSALNGYLLYATDTQIFTIGVLEINKITLEDLANCLNLKAENSQLIIESEYYKIIQAEEGNYQDKAVVVLLWNEIKGENQYDEIINLKIENIDIKNKLVMIGNKIIELDEIEINIIEKAIREKEYKKIKFLKNGDITETLVPYTEGDYVIKSTEWRRNLNATDNKCSYSTFANRMSTYFTMALGRSELTGLKVYKSSVYYHLIKDYGRKVLGVELEKYLAENDIKISMSGSNREEEIMFNKMREQGII